MSGATKLRLASEEDLSDLPPELLRELSGGRKHDVLEDQILAIMEELGPPVKIDQVLIGLYRKFGVLQTRRFIQNKLYRMYKAGLIKMPSRALYSLSKAQNNPNDRRY